MVGKRKPVVLLPYCDTGAELVRCGARTGAVLLVTGGIFLGDEKNKVDKLLAFRKKTGHPKIKLIKVKVVKSEASKSEVVKRKFYYNTMETGNKFIFFN